MAGRTKENQKSIVNGKELDLKKLSRTELLELLLEQTKELEASQAKVEELEKKLADRKIELKEAGNIAEAALKLNRIFEAAQQAADDYLYSVTGKHPAGTGEDNKEPVKPEKAQNEEAETGRDSGGKDWDTSVSESELQKPLPDLQGAPA